MNMHRPMTPADDAQSFATVEGQIREVIRREVAGSPKPPAEIESGAGGVSSIIQRVAGSSVKEINRLESDSRSWSRSCRVCENYCKTKGNAFSGK